MESGKMEELLLAAARADTDDCAKAFVCELNTKTAEPLSEMERAVFDIFAEDAALDVNRESVQFQLAALVGRLAGLRQCKTVYSRCPVEYPGLLEAMEGNVPAQVPVSNQF